MDESRRANIGRLYLDLQSTPTPQGRFFVLDANADGLLTTAPGQGSTDVIDDGDGKSLLLNGDPQEVNAAEYEATSHGRRHEVRAASTAAAWLHSRAASLIIHRQVSDPMVACGMTGGLRILVADGHAAVRQSLRTLLEEQTQCRVVAEAADGREAVRLAVEEVPDVVVMDLALSLLNGIEATRQIVRRVPRAKVVILSMHVDDAYVASILEAGAVGYLLKYCADIELVPAVTAVASGEVFVSPAIPRGVRPDHGRATPRR